MHKLSDLLFVSSNIHKFKEAKQILDSFKGYFGREREMDDMVY